MVVAFSLVALGQAVAPQPPEPAPQRLTLNEAVSRALGRNPTVAVAVAEIDRADALINEARCRLVPDAERLRQLHPARSRARDRQPHGARPGAGDQRGGGQPDPDRAAGGGAGLDQHTPRPGQPPHRRGERARRAPAGGAGDGARLPDRRRAAQPHRRRRDGAGQRQGPLRLRAHALCWRGGAQHRRGARAAGPGQRRRPGPGDLLRRWRARARRWACWSPISAPVDSVERGRSRRHALAGERARRGGRAPHRHPPPRRARGDRQAGGRRRLGLLRAAS